MHSQHLILITLQQQIWFTEYHVNLPQNNIKYAGIGTMNNDFTFKTGSYIVQVHIGFPSSTFFVQLILFYFNEVDKLKLYLFIQLDIMIYQVLFTASSLSKQDKAHAHEKFH